MNPCRTLLAVLSLGLLSACMTAPTTNIHQPVTARPLPPPNRVDNGGAIFNPGGRSLFEDRRARYVGDTLTVNLVEKTKASKSSNSGASKDASMSLASPAIAGLPFKFLNNASLGGTSGETFAGKGAAAANNDFTGTITVTVVDVYPNGNLLVSGEKMVAINQGNEFIRFSGVINPNNVTAANTVQSTQVADARIEYRGSGFIDESNTMGWLQRFFVAIMPF